METEHYRYCLRCNPSQGDYNCYCTAYDLTVQRQNMARDKPLVGRVTYETNRLRRLFSAFECVAELNADLLKSTVSEVLVTRQNVKLRLKNGQVIERSDLQ